MLCEHRQHHRAIFTALRFVNAHGERMHYLIQFAEFVINRAAVKINRHALVFKINFDNAPQIAVKHLLVVIVARLQNFVADAENARAVPRFAFALCLRIQRVLQNKIEFAHARLPAMHRRQDLHIVNAVQMKAFRNARRHQFHHALGGLLGFFFGKQKEIARVVAKQRHLALIDAVRVCHNQRRFVLTKNHIERDNGHHLRRNQIFQHIARAHTRQLVRVTHKQNMRGQINGFDKRVHQEQINHRSFVHDD